METAQFMRVVLACAGELCKRIYSYAVRKIIDRKLQSVFETRTFEEMRRTMA